MKKLSKSQRMKLLSDGMKETLRSLPDDVLLAAHDFLHEQMEERHGTNKRGKARADSDAILATVEKWTDRSHIRLHAGEMTAQEMRTALAVANGILSDLKRGLNSNE